MKMSRVEINPEMKKDEKPKKRLACLSTAANSRTGMNDRTPQN
jgi:hypothetical protein